MQKHNLQKAAYQQISNVMFDAMLHLRPHAAINKNNKAVETDAASAFKHSLGNMPLYPAAPILQTKLLVNEPGDKYEEEADAMADKVMRMQDTDSVQPVNKEEDKQVQRKTIPAGINPAIQNKSEAAATASNTLRNKISASSGKGNAMDSNTQAFMSNGFGADFNNVKIHTDSEAINMNQELNAKAFTLGNDIYFNEAQYNVGSASGKLLLAHELTHVLQQKKHIGLNKVQRQALPTDLSAYPENDRKRIQISWIAVKAGSLPGMNDSFGTTAATAGGSAVTSSSGNGTVIFNGNVPATPSTKDYDVRHGLNNIAYYLQNTSNILPLNSTVTITLNLTPYKGINGNYRFTYFQHESGTGKAATLDEVTLIEQLGAATAAPTVADPTNAAPAGDFKQGTETFKLGSGWTFQQQAILNQALALVPANGLTQLSGVTFNIGSVSGTEEGHYEESNHSITIRTSAFDDRLNAYEGGSDAVRIILHEVAHAIDRMPVRKAWSTYDAGGQTAAGKSKLEKTKSLSGSSYVDNKKTKTYNLVEGATATDFRTAVIKDRTQKGVTLPPGITSYSATNWEENFGEAFGLYMTDRKLFEQLRPNTFLYFQKNYP